MYIHGTSLTRIFMNYCPTRLLPSTEHRRRSSLPYYSCQATTVPDLRGPWSAGAGADGTASGEQKMRVKCLRADRSLISPNGCFLHAAPPCSADPHSAASGPLAFSADASMLDAEGMLRRRCSWEGTIFVILDASC
jgi:hypothetical protein